MKSSEVSIKTRSTAASLTIQSQVTKDKTVKWSIHQACVQVTVGRAEKELASSEVEVVGRREGEGGVLLPNPLPLLAFFPFSSLPHPRQESLQFSKSATEAVKVETGKKV